MKTNVLVSISLILVLSSSAVFSGTTQDPQETLSEQDGGEFGAVVPEGTIIPIILTAYLNTRSSQVGDKFYADTTYPIWVSQRLVIPKGSTIRGTVTELKRPGKIKGKGQIALRFDDILLPNGVKRDLTATFRGMHGGGEETMDRSKESVEAGGSKGEDVGTVVGTSTSGAILGSVIGRSGKGGLIGAGAGAAGGIAMVLFSRGRDLVLSPGTQFDLELKKPMRFDHNELEFSPMQLDNAQRSIQPAPRTTPQPQDNGQGTPRIGWPRPF